MMNYSTLIAELENSPLEAIIEILPDDFQHNFNHGDFPGWLEALQSLKSIAPSSYELSSTLKIGEPAQCSDDERQQLKSALLKLQPWRKGPFELFGLELNTEWRSDWKWDRLESHISPLNDRVVLDVGCGNGYHCWRMAGAGAKLVLGIDPHLLFNMQYWAIRHFLEGPPVHVIPVALEGLPSCLAAFDSVFSMGVLYHRRSPIDHLYRLKEALRSGGELILETIVIDGEAGMSLVPQGRYSRMPNVWFLPTCGTLENWLQKSGFVNIRLVDVSITTIEEQRSTEWMRFESLSRALDETNPNLTIEGYPAPKRAIFIAEKP